MIEKIIKQVWFGPSVTALFAIIGWFVIYCIVRHNRKMTERIRLINQKNDLLSKLLELACALWSRDKDAPYSSAREREIVLLIERILNIYKELENLDGKREQYALILLRPSLRPLVTLNVEDAHQMEEEKLEQKRRSIKEFIEILYGIPDKGL